MGEGDLLPEDRYLLEINLDDKTTSGEKQEYWLLAIRAARAAYALRSRRARRERSTAETELDEPAQAIEEAQDEEDEVAFQSPPRMRRVAAGRAEVNEVESDFDEDNFDELALPPRVSRVTGATENHRRQRREDV